MAASILTVVTPAVTHDLTTLETVKDELNVTDTASDARYTRWIAEASGFVRSYCNRTFASETVSELWRPGTPAWSPDRNWSGLYADYNRSWNHADDRSHGALKLRRWPVTAIVSISEDDAAALTTDDYEIDAEMGWVWRLSGQSAGVGGVRSGWYASKIVVTYTAGYALLDGLPYGIESACIEVVKHRQFARERDPMLRQQSIPGELEQQWWVPGANESGVPPTIRAMLDPWRELNV